MKSIRVITYADLVLARRIAAQYGPAGDDELESAAMHGLLTAAGTFNGKGTWHGYATQRIRWAVIDLTRKSAPEPIDASLLPDNTEPFGMDATEREDYADLHAALEDLRCDYLLDGVDRRRMADRGALLALKKELS